MKSNQKAGTKMFEEALDGFKWNLRAGIKVAGEAESADKLSAAVTIEEFSQMSGVGRSTLAKYLGNSKNANPDLRTICAIADVMAIPPAFLLMRPTDWSRLLQAKNSEVGALMELERNASLREFARMFSEGTDLDARLVAIIKFAKRMGIRLEAPGAQNEDTTNVPVNDKYSRHRKAIRFAGSLGWLKRQAETTSKVGDATVMMLSLIFAVTLFSLDE